MDDFSEAPLMVTLTTLQGFPLSILIESRPDESTQLLGVLIFHWKLADWPALEERYLASAQPEHHMTPSVHRTATYFDVLEELLFFDLRDHFLATYPTISLVRELQAPEITDFSLVAGVITRKVRDKLLEWKSEHQLDSAFGPKPLS